MKKYRLTGTKILLERTEAKTQTEGGIFIPAQSQENLLQGTIKAVGPDVKIVSGGEEIMFENFAGTSIMLEANLYLVMDEADLILIFEK